MEVLILDDSHESASEAVESFASSAAVRVDYRYSSERLSIGAKRNMAVRLSEAEVVCIWDDDDLYTADRVRLQVEALQELRCNCVMMERRFFYWKSSGILRACSENLQLLPLENTLCFWRRWFEGKSFEETSLNEGLGLLRGRRGLKHPGRLGIVCLSADELPFLYVKHEGSMTGEGMVAMVPGAEEGHKPSLAALQGALKRFPKLPSSCVWHSEVLAAVRRLGGGEVLAGF